MFFALTPLPIAHTPRNSKYLDNRQVLSRLFGLESANEIWRSTIMSCTILFVCRSAFQRKGATELTRILLCAVCWSI